MHHSKEKKTQMHERRRGYTLRWYRVYTWWR